MIHTACVVTSTHTGGSDVCHRSHTRHTPRHMVTTPTENSTQGYVITTITTIHTACMVTRTYTGGSDVCHKSHTRHTPHHKVTTPTENSTHGYAIISNRRRRPMIHTACMVTSTHTLGSDVCHRSHTCHTPRHKVTTPTENSTQGYVITTIRRRRRRPTIHTACVVTRTHTGGSDVCHRSHTRHTPRHKVTTPTENSTQGNVIITIRSHTRLIPRHKVTTPTENSTKGNVIITITTIHTAWVVTSIHTRGSDVCHRSHTRHTPRHKVTTPTENSTHGYVISLSGRYTRRAW